MIQNVIGTENKMSVEDTIKLYEESDELKIAEALETLQKTPEWDIVFNEELFKNTVNRLALLRKDPEVILNTEPIAIAQRNSIDELLDAIGTIYSHFNSIINNTFLIYLIRIIINNSYLLLFIIIRLCRRSISRYIQ